MVIYICMLIGSMSPSGTVVAMVDSGYGSTSGGGMGGQPPDDTVEPPYPTIMPEPDYPDMDMEMPTPGVTKLPDGGAGAEPTGESKPDEGEGEGSSQAPNITNIIMNCECVGVLNQMLLEIQKSKPSVTALYSENRRMAGCYYRPDYANLSKQTDLAAEIALDHKFAAVYSGYFDLYDKEITEVGEYKPDGSQCRELEVLGYDFLLEREEYDEGSRTYTPTVYDREYVTWQVAVMDLYKALGKEIISYALYFESDENAGERVTLNNSPISQSLPSYVSELDTSRVETHLFVTRTYAVGKYYDRAVSELGVGRLYMRDDIGNSDFIILVANAMQRYGEPVMSEMEMNMLLQVYGGTIPEYLNEIERDAYLYLKARGVLNVDLDYTQKLKFKDMLNILMCVKDKESRTDFKSIQVTVDIGEELVNMGYFPKTVNIVDESAVYVKEQELTDRDLANGVDYYDYFILVGDDTEFRSRETGELVTDEKIFISAVNGENEKGARAGTRYLGRKEFDGREYYHFQAPQSFSGVMEFNTEETTDTPYFMCIPEKQLRGGIYVYKKSKKGEVTLKREGSFDSVEGLTGTYGVWDRERIQKARKVSWLDELGDWLVPSIRVYAKEEMAGLSSFAYPKLSGRQAYDKEVEFLVYNVGEGACYVGAEDRAEITDNGDGTWTVRTTAGLKNYVMNNIVRSESSPGVMYGAICNLAGDVLVDYDTLVEAGLFNNDYGGQIPTPDDQNGQILRLTGKFGQVKLNNTTREIVAGNVIYKLKNDGGAGLFKFLEERGEQKLYVDFRVAYGWALDKLQMTITGTAQSYTVNVYDRAATENLFTKVGVLPAEPFVTANDSLAQGQYLPGTSTEVVPGNMLDSCKQPSILLTSSYSLANWIMYQGVNPESGTADEYIYVYYLRAAMEDYGIDIPNGQKGLKNKLGYVVCDNDLWCVREFSAAELVRSGKLRYVEGVGYLYQLPEFSAISMEAYLRGEVLFPVGYDLDNNCLRNINVCKFGDFPYGTRPKMEASMEYVDIHGMGGELDVSTFQDEISFETVSADPVMPAPVGISSMYGGGPRLYTTMANTSLISDLDTSLVYFGINLCKLVPDSRSGRLELGFLKWGNAVQREVQGGVTSPIKLRLAGTVSRVFTNSTVVYSCYVVEEARLSVAVSEEPVVADIEVEPVKVIDAERKDVFVGYEKLSLRGLLDKIDQGATSVIFIVFTVFPMLGVALITMLVGLAMIADFKGARLFAEKVFDPVKLLTFGKRNMDNFQIQDCIFSMLVGYTIFALLYDGNLIRILMWLFEVYDEVVKHIMYL